MTESEKALVERLDEEGATGLDLSPGNPTSRDAAALIRRQSEEIDTLAQALNASYLLHDVPGRGRLDNNHAPALVIAEERA